MHTLNKSLVQLSTGDRKFVTFAGVETFLLFIQQFPMRDFCAFEILDDDDAWAELEEGLLFPTLDAAASANMGILTDTLCWRGSSDAVKALGYQDSDVERFNRLGVKRICKLISRWREERNIDEEACPVVLAAEIGPRGDGYTMAGEQVSAKTARLYHLDQMRSIAATEAEVVVALTMTNLNEALGIVQAAREVGMPIIVSPTIETDGLLPDGTPLGKFIEEIDAISLAYPMFYMVNCAHPIHLEPVLDAADKHGESWLGRFRGFRANASCKSHAELDNSTALDRGDIPDFSNRMAELSTTYNLQLLGGCCGTDSEHIKSMVGAMQKTGQVACGHSCNPVPVI